MASRRELSPPFLAVEVGEGDHDRGRSSLCRLGMPQRTAGHTTRMPVLSLQGIKFCQQSDEQETHSPESSEGHGRDASMLAWGDPYHTDSDLQGHSGSCKPCPWGHVFWQQHQTDAAAVERVCSLLCNSSTPGPLPLPWGIRQRHTRGSGIPLSAELCD